MGLLILPTLNSFCLPTVYIDPNKTDIIYLFFDLKHYSVIHAPCISCSRLSPLPLFLQGILQSGETFQATWWGTDQTIDKQKDLVLDSLFSVTFSLFFLLILFKTNCKKTVFHKQMGGRHTIMKFMPSHCIVGTTSSCDITGFKASGRCLLQIGLFFLNF